MVPGAVAALLAVLVLVVEGPGPGRAEDAPYLVLSEISPCIGIRNVMLRAPMGASRIACDGSSVLIFLAPTEREEAGSAAVDVAIEMSFDVHDMVMGPGAGRAVVLVDDEAVGECAADRCRVRLPASQLLTKNSDDAGNRQDAPSSSAPKGSSSVRSTNHVQVMLVAPEPDMPTQAVALGVQRSFSLGLVPAERGGLLPEAMSDAITREHAILSGELISASYCTEGEPEGEDAGAAACALSAQQQELDNVDGHTPPAHGELEGWVAGRAPARLAMEGESSAAQHLFMQSLVGSHPEVRRVLEIGFHAGLSARAFLSARADVQMVSFDIGRHGHEEQFWREVIASFPARHTLILADSLTGLPAFHQHNRFAAFDLFYIDGGHTYHHARTDLLNCASIARFRLSQALCSGGGALRGGGPEEHGAGALVLMDDLTPWVYWGVGPDRAWREAIEAGTIRLVGYYREILKGEAGGGEGEGAGEGAGGGRWVEMAADAYDALVADYTRRRAAFAGSDENAEIIKVWALGRFVVAEGACAGEGDGAAPGGDASEFVVEGRWPRPREVSGGVRGVGQHAVPFLGERTDGERGHDEVTGADSAADDGVAVCVLGQESELEALIVSLRSVLVVLPTWRVKIYSPPKIAAAVRHRLMPVVALSRAYGRVAFAQLEALSDEAFSRNASTSVVWGSHRTDNTGRVRVLHQDGNGVHYDTLFKTRRFWESVPSERILVFQADSLLCEHSPWAVDDFLGYDYVGSPWRQEVCPPDNDRSVSICLNDYVEMVRLAGFFELEGYAPPAGQGGNGGLSLRRRSKMLEIVDKCRHSASMDWNEDVFFSFPCPPVSIALPSVETASHFGVESGPFYAQPFGVHKPWRHRSLDDLMALSDACTWLPSLAALSGVVVNE